jgi:hypothetical protein
MVIWQGNDGQRITPGSDGHGQVDILISRQVRFKAEL